MFPREQKEEAKKRIAGARRKMERLKKEIQNKSNEIEASEDSISADVYRTTTTSRVERDFLLEAHEILWEIALENGIVRREVPKMGE
jgi:uncharacterized protein involved in exopolysaccharide biosynthesis